MVASIPSPRALDAGSLHQAQYHQQSGVLWILLNLDKILMPLDRGVDGGPEPEPHDADADPQHQSQYHQQSGVL